MDGKVLDLFVIDDLLLLLLLLLLQLLGVGSRDYLNYSLLQKREREKEVKRIDLIHGQTGQHN